MTAARCIFGEITAVLRYKRSRYGAFEALIVVHDTDRYWITLANTTVEVTP